MKKAIVFLITLLITLLLMYPESQERNYNAIHTVVVCPDNNFSECKRLRVKGSPSFSEYINFDLKSKNP